MKKLIFALSLLFIFACVSKSDFEKLQAQNELLKTNLEECQNGAEKIIAIVNKAYSEKDYVLAKDNIKKLNDKHPESPKNKEFAVLLKTINEEELAANKIKEAEELAAKEKKAIEEKERIRLENINNTGMWAVSYYVDDFGAPTKQAYIYNKNDLFGTFSNTATQDSELKVAFLISSANKISIQLYEYAGNNPVKAYSSDSYRVLVQDKDGVRLKLSAVNYSERLTLNSTDSKQLHNALMKGGTLKFRIVEIDTPTTQYEFEIRNADWYENAYTKLKES